MPDHIEVYKGFLRLTQTAWVRADAIVVIHARMTNEGEAAEVLVRATTKSTGVSGSTSYGVWTSWPAEAIIDAIARAERP